MTLLFSYAFIEPSKSFIITNCNMSCLNKNPSYPLRSSLCDTESSRALPWLPVSWSPPKLQALMLIEIFLSLLSPVRSTWKRKSRVLALSWEVILLNPSLNMLLFQMLLSICCFNDFSTSRLFCQYLKAHLSFLQSLQAIGYQPFQTNLRIGRKADILPKLHGFCFSRWNIRFCY